MVKTRVHLLVTTSIMALLLVACGAPAASSPPAAAPSPTTPPVASPPPESTTAPTTGPTVSATGTPSSSGNAATAAPAAAAPDPCALLTVDEIGKAYGTPFNAGQRTETVDDQVKGAKLHECEWQSTSNALGAIIHVYVDVQSNADLSALDDKDINNVDGYVHNTNHFIGAKPTQVPGLTGGTALRNGANEIDVLTKSVLLRVSSSSGKTQVIPGLAAAAAGRLGASGAP